MILREFWDPDVRGDAPTLATVKKWTLAAALLDAKSMFHHRNVI